MKKSGLLVFAVFAAFFFGGDAFARNLSVDDAVGLVLAESQDIKKAAANVEKMEATLSGVHAGRFPKLDATAAYQTNAFGLPIQATMFPVALPGNMGTAGLSVSMPIFTFGKIGWALGIARRALKIAEASKQLAEVEVRAAAVQLYWSAKAADEMVRLAEKSLKNTKSAAAQLTRTGRANRSNLVKISADVAAREIDFADAKFNRDSAFRMLKVYAGIDEAEHIVLTSQFPDKFPDIIPKEINPYEWDIYELQAKMHDAEKWQSYAGYMPTIAATGKYDYTAMADRAADLFGSYVKSASVGIAIQWTLFDGGAKRAAATAGAMSAIMAREDLDKSRKVKTAEYNDLIQKYAHLRRNLADLGRAKELAEKAYQLSKDRFLAGQTSATELADVERGATGTEMAIIGAKLQIMAAMENIKKFENEK